MNIDSLLKECGAIVKSEIESGDRYSIFDVLGDYRKELMHSAVIASFLDPRGKHGQGSVFLKHFTDAMGIYDFEPDGAYVTCEKVIGDVVQTEDGWLGGRIDIHIEDTSGRRIIIENKIDAGDQYRQIERYNKYDPKATILYLTLDGHRPAGDSTGSCTSYECISYRKHIINWMDSCIADQSIPEYLRETMKNYRNLFANNILKTDMSDLINVLKKNKENLDAAFEIASSISTIKIETQHNLWRLLKEELNDLKPFYYSLEKGDVDSLVTLIEKYYRSDSKESSRFFGIAVPLGKKDGVELSLAMLVNINLNICVVANSADGKKQLSRYFKDLIKAKEWSESKLDKVVAWRYPLGKQYSFQDFNEPEVKYLAIDQKHGIINQLAKDFRDVLKEVNNLLEI